MTKQTINIESFTIAIEKAVEDRGGDFVYPLAGMHRDAADLPLRQARLDSDWWIEGRSCAYFLPDGKPACIIGQALANLGYEEADLTRGQRFAASEMFDHIPDLESDMDVEEQTRLLYAMDQAQSAQDGGNSWGEALREFHSGLRDG
jgi:hypothetical protein